MGLLLFCLFFLFFWGEQVVLFVLLGFWGDFFCLFYFNIVVVVVFCVWFLCVDFVWWIFGLSVLFCWFLFVLFRFFF